MSEYPHCSLEFLSINATAHYDPRIARKLGINPAIILSRIIWSINKKIEIGRLQDKQEENWWMWDSVLAFCEYSGMSRNSFETAKRKLKSENIIIIQKTNRKTLDHTNHYAVNWEEYRRQFPDSGDSRQSNALIPGNRMIEIQETDSLDSRQSNALIPGNVPKNLSNTLPKNLSNTHSKTPLPPKGGENGNGSLGVNLISIGRERKRREPPINSNATQKRTIISPVRLYRRTVQSHPQLAQLGQLALSCTWSNEHGEDGCVCGVGRDACDNIPAEEIPY